MTWNDVLESIRSSWEWIISNDLPQGWAILIGLGLGLGAIAWQTNKGFRSLIKNQQNQAELNRQAKLQMSLQQHSSETNARAADGKTLAAALLGELTACHQMCSLQATNIGGVQGAPNSPATSAPVYQSTIPQLGLLGASLVADVVTAYSWLHMEARCDRPSKAELTDIAQVITRLRAFQEGSRDPGPVFSVKRTEEAEDSAYAKVGSEKKTTLVTASGDFR